jgi:integrase
MTIDIPKDQMKSGRNFSLPLNDVAVQILRESAKNGMDGLVLDTCNFRKEFDQLKKDAKIDNLTIHDLRRTFGSHLAKNGCDIQTIADLMDHSNLEMTRRYARLSPDRKRNAVDTLNLGAGSKVPHLTTGEPKLLIK